MGDAYGWIKVCHLLGVFSWMAGLFYLPRLMVYHAMSGAGSDVSEQFKVMEHRLLAAIMRPAAAVSLLFGIWAGLDGSWFAGSWWLWWKMVPVAGLLAVHGLLEFHVREFRLEKRTRSHRYFRILNEVPTLALFAIVVLAVLKPF